MQNKEYISYLNTLHNYNAQNKNAYGEKNVESPFFNNVMVKIELCDFIVKRLQENHPHIIILTGHAGDGKTSLMYQVIHELGKKFEIHSKVSDIELENGAVCKCIKDFSELSDDNKLKTMKEVVTYPESGKFVFMVANTGPLIHTFGELFDDKETKEKMKIELINKMDQNTGKIETIGGYKICLINVATIDNTYFATEFLEKILADSLWEKCLQCFKCEYCHIYRNKKLIKQNKQRVFKFIYLNYVWLTEYGNRITIRSMTEQLTYMITGGINCIYVKKEDAYKYLFSNLFLGYIGTRENIKAKNLVAIKNANSCKYDKRKLRSDEELLIKKNYDVLFGKEIVDIIKMAEKKNAYVLGWTEFLKRTYLFLNIVTDESMIKNDMEDIFSKHFQRFLELQSKKSNSFKTDVNLIIDALLMIYTGRISGESEIPLTLSKESGIMQNVQLVTGIISTRKMNIIQENTQSNLFNHKKERYSLKLKIDHEVLQCELSLPMFDYFEELRNGVIATNIDPQLSHGVESLKAQLSEKMDDVDDDLIEMIILKNNGNESIRLEIEENRNIRQI